MTAITGIFHRDGRSVDYNQIKKMNDQFYLIEDLMALKFIVKDPWLLVIKCFTPPLNLSMRHYLSKVMVWLSLLMLESITVRNFQKN